MRRSWQCVWPFRAKFRAFQRTPRERGVYAAFTPLTVESTCWVLKRRKGFKELHFVPIFGLSSVSADEHKIVEFLRKTSEFVSVVKISLNVGGRKRCRTSPCWARQDLLRLSTLGILEPDYKGRFRFKAPPKVHLAPQVAEILGRAKARFAALFGT